MNNENEINNIKVNNNEPNQNKDINEITGEPKKHREFDTNMKLPELDKTQKEIQTVKKKQRSSVPYIIILLVVAFLTIYYMDSIIEIIDSFTKPNTLPLIVNNTKEEEKKYIIINDNTNNITVEKIKFYNFIKSKNDQVITFNYTPSIKIDNLKDKNIFIELYDSEENLLYKTQFLNEEILFSNEIKTYSLKLNSDIYTSSYYASIKVYTIEELNKETKITCSYTEMNNYSLTYKNEYTFKNDLLVSYKVYKQISYINENDMTKKYKKEIDTEYNLLKEFKIDSTYQNNTLNYMIDLNNDLNGFIPLYEKDTTIYIVKNKDINKKWNCE